MKIVNFKKLKKENRREKMCIVKPDAKGGSCVCC